MKTLDDDSPRDDFFFGRIGGSSVDAAPAVRDEDDRGITEGSSKCPAGVSKRPPSGLKVNRRKKFVNPSSPYSLAEAHDAVEVGVRIAGRGGMGEGDLPYALRDECGGDGAAVDPLNDDRRDGIRSFGGNIVVADGVLTREADGVSGVVETMCPAELDDEM
jgi:hypothetical protein